MQDIIFRPYQSKCAFRCAQLIKTNQRSEGNLKIISTSCLCDKFPYIYRSVHCGKVCVNKKTRFAKKCWSNCCSSAISLRAGEKIYDQYLIVYSSNPCAEWPSESTNKEHLNIARCIHIGICKCQLIFKHFLFCWLTYKFIVNSMCRRMSWLKYEEFI